MRPKTHPRATNSDQKDRKSEPRAPQEHPQASCTIFLAPGGAQKKGLIRNVKFFFPEFVCKISGSRTQVFGFFQGSWRV